MALMAVAKGGVFFAGGLPLTLCGVWKRSERRLFRSVGLGPGLIHIDRQLVSPVQLSLPACALPKSQAAFITQSMLQHPGKRAANGVLVCGRARDLVVNAAGQSPHNLLLAIMCACT
eukprot:2758896-Rhodomonas_salina.3